MLHVNVIDDALCYCGAVVMKARKTPRGFYWFSPATGRAGKKSTFPTALAALEAGAHQHGYTITPRG